MKKKKRFIDCRYPLDLVNIVFIRVGNCFVSNLHQSYVTLASYVALSIDIIYKNIIRMDL